MHILRQLFYLPELAEDDTDWNPWGEEFDNEQVVISHHEPPKILWNLEPAKDSKSNNRGSNSTGMFNVEIWGKAAIGKASIGGKSISTVELQWLEHPSNHEVRANEC